MPFGVSATQYLTTIVIFTMTGIAGSTVVFHRYKPLEGIEEQVEEEKEKIREEFMKYCERKIGEKKMEISNS